MLRFIIQCFAEALKLAAYGLNGLLSIFFFMAVCNSYDDQSLSLSDWIKSLMICATPPVMLIAMVLAFHKRDKILTPCIIIIAFILNGHCLIRLIWFETDPHDFFPLYITYLVMVLLNFVVLALTFTVSDKTGDNQKIPKGKTCELK